MTTQASGNGAELAQRTLQSLLRAAGVEADQAHDVNFVDGEPAYASRVRCAELAAAALAAGGVVASALWHERTGRRQSVHVALREAAASLTSFAHLRFDDATRAPPPNLQRERGAAFGFFATRDARHIFLHASFPPNHERVLQVLGVANDDSDVRAAVAKRNAFELEADLRMRGLTAAVALSPEEWDASMQGRMLAGRPVVEIVRVADSPPEPLPDTERVLGGVRVLDLTRVLAGPTCARTLAQYGANVLHVANSAMPTVPLFVADTGHGKRNANLDLAQHEARAQLLELARGADVFSQGYRSGSLQRLGLGVAELMQLRPGLIYTSINCYGHEGPLTQQPGWEQLAQTATGLAQIHGGAGSPQLQPCAVTDYCTGYLAAFGTMVALLRRARYGGSYLVRASLCQTGMLARALPLHADNANVAFSAAELDAWRLHGESGFGPMRYLRPALQLSETPTHWSGPGMPLGTADAVW